ncbi:MAG TPA: hypothetical protein VKR60_06280 [Candidatus Sulfotelmatobacter sp.]|nr:hypothetical protein [Candidatus Sulfotelmatobacter sp.]
MRPIELHDNLNPNQVVALDADAITGIRPLPTGSAVACGAAIYTVHESPAEVEALWRTPSP